MAAGNTSSSSVQASDGQLGAWSHRGGLVAAALRHGESQTLVVVVLLLAIGVSEVGAQSNAAPSSLVGFL